MRQSSLVIGVLLIGFGVSLGEEFSAVIKKVTVEPEKKPQITVNKKAKDFKGKGADTVLELSDDVVITWNKYNLETKKLEAGEPVENGLQNEALVKIDKFEKGISARLTTNTEGKVAKITLLGSKIVVRRNLDKVLEKEKQDEEKKAKLEEEKNLKK